MVDAGSDRHVGGRGVGKRGGQLQYSEVAIEAALTLRLFFHLPLRQTEVFLRSIFGMLGLDLSAPDHTTLSRRAQRLNLTLCRVFTGTGIHLLVDSTGPSMVGEGEWAAVKHGRRGTRGGTLKDKAKKVVSSLRHAGLLTGDYTRHDFRRTVATSMEGMGITTSTIAKLMNHVEAGPRATHVYARHPYDTEKRQALEAWGRHLDALIHGVTSARIMPFRQ